MLCDIAILSGQIGLGICPGRTSTLGNIARSRNTIAMLRAAVGLALLLVCLAPLAAGQTVSAQAQAVNQNVKEVYFPFNIYNRVIDPAVLDANAAWLKQNPDGKLWIQGYADPRGDIVYNLVLSYHRAQWVKSQLVNAEWTSRESNTPPDGASFTRPAKPETISASSRTVASMWCLPRP